MYTVAYLYLYILFTLDHITNLNLIKYEADVLGLQVLWKQNVSLFLILKANLLVIWSKIHIQIALHHYDF